MNGLLGIATATAAAISFGSADFAGGRGARQWTPVGAAMVVQLVGLPALLLVVAVANPPWSHVGLLVGLASGVAAAVGLFALYSGLAAGGMGIVTCIAGISVAGFAILFDATALHQIPSMVQLVGIGTATGAGLLAAKGTWIANRAVLLALAAGLGFGGCFILFDIGAGASPLWTLVGARAAAGLVLGVAWLVSDHSGPGPVGVTLVGAGFLDTTANGLMIAAVTMIPVGLAASVAAVAPPIVTMMLARYLLHESMPAHGYVSFALACLGIGLMVVG